MYRTFQLFRTDAACAIATCGYSNSESAYDSVQLGKRSPAFGLHRKPKAAYNPPEIMSTFVTAKRLAISIVSSSQPRWRMYSVNIPNPKEPRSPHAQWYADIVPAMIPIFLLGSAVYLGLQLTQQKLSHEKYMEETSERVKALAAEVESLQAERMRRENKTPPIATSPNKTSRWWW